MKEPTLDITQSIGEYLLERRTFLGKAGAASLGAVLTALGAPAVAGAFGSVPPPSSYSTLLGLCTPGTATSTFTPGLTNTLQAIHVDASITFSPCAVAQNKAITGMRDSFDSIQSCVAQTDSSGGGAIFYTNGQTSTWTMDSWGGSRLGGQYSGACSGLITNGPFNGARLWKFIMRTARDPADCSRGGGLTSATGTNTLILAMP